MASTMVINVRYFGTTKVKIGDRVRQFRACVDKNGELIDLDMGLLQQKICSLLHLPHGADITLVYIDEDRDVVTLVDDNDLRDALRQKSLKSFRIDVLMNDDKNGGELSTSKRNQVKSSTHDFGTTETTTSSASLSRQNKNMRF